MAEGVILRLTHAHRVLPSPPYTPGTVRTSSILIDDIRETENQRGLVLPPLYLPYGTDAVPGFIDLQFTTLVARSYETGDIRRLIDDGDATHQFLVGGNYQRGTDGRLDVTSTAGAPSPDVFTLGVDDSHVFVDTTNDAVRIHLPAGATHLRGWFRVMDLGNNALANSITLVPNGAEMIAGGGSYLINTNGLGLCFVWDGTGWVLAQALSGAPSGAAAGDLSGTYPNPAVSALTETGGPTSLPLGAVADGQYLRRIGGNIVGAAAGGGGWVPNIVEVVATPYNVAVDEDYVLVHLAVPAPTVVNLPAGAAHSTGVVTIKDKTGTATANNITINADGAETIDGAASTAIDQDYASVTLVFSGTEWSLV